MTRLRKVLNNHKGAKLAEIAAIFIVGLAVVGIGWNFVDTDPLARQAVVWLANISMIGTIWLGLAVRGQSWKHFGLSFALKSAGSLFKMILYSIAVLVLALLFFIAGSIVATSLVSAPESADMSGYNYLQGNLALLLVALAAVYVVSSFGEEAIYRGFLMNRIAELGDNRKSAWFIAVVASSIIFGLIHFDWGWTGIIQTGFMGLALALAYIVSKRNLPVLILAHAYLDTLLLVQLYLAPAPLQATG